MRRHLASRLTQALVGLVVLAVCVGWTTLLPAQTTSKNTEASEAAKTIAPPHTGPDFSRYLALRYTVFGPHPIIRIGSAGVLLRQSIINKLVKFGKRTVTVKDWKLKTVDFEKLKKGDRIYVVYNSKEVILFVAPPPPSEPGDPSAEEQARQSGSSESGR